MFQTIPNLVLGVREVWNMMEYGAKSEVLYTSILATYIKYYSSKHFELINYQTIVLAPVTIKKNMSPFH